MYFNTVRPTRFLGVVEARAHQVSSISPGIVSQLLVDVGHRVKAGQELARIYSADARGIDTLRAVADLLRVENAFRDEIAELEAMRAEVAGLNAQISRLKKAGVGSLVPSQNLADLVIRRDALQANIRERLKLLEDMANEYLAHRLQDSGMQGAAADSPETPAIERYKQLLKALHRQLLDYEGRISSERIRSPCDGQVTAIYARPGDAIDAFQPILTVVESSPVYLEAYVPERANLTLREGDRVIVESMRSGIAPAGGTVKFVHGEVSPLPDRLVVTRTHPWVRRVYIELDRPHELLPGEKVRVKAARKRFAFGCILRFADAAEGGDPGGPEVGSGGPAFRKVQLPRRLWMRTRFEPSGLLWLEDIDRFLVISDDTGCRGRDGHAPWLFLMDKDGLVEPEPVRLIGVDEIDDLEAVADRGDGIIYLLSSQSLNKRGKRRAGRQYLLEVERQGRRFAVLRRVELFSLLVESYGEAGLARLGLTQRTGDGKLVLDVEGMVYRDGCLYLGLKEPVGEDGAFIWRITDLDRVFSGSRLAPDQVSIYARVDLGGRGGLPAGISDMVLDEAGRLLILSTLVGAADSEQAGGCFVVDDFHRGRLNARQIFSFPKLKPEGICRIGAGRFRIVFDTGTDCLDGGVASPSTAELPPFVDFELPVEKR